MNDPFFSMKFYSEWFMSAAIAGLLTIISSLCHGEETYRWTDEKGHVHYGDSVPYPYKRSASIVDTKSAVVTDSERREAELRFARDKELLSKSKSLREASTPASTSAKTTANDHDTSCEAQWKKHDESWACFNPYRTANGSVKAEAYQHCTEIKAPDCVRPSTN